MSWLKGPSVWIHVNLNCGLAPVIWASMLPKPPLHKGCFTVVDTLKSGLKSKTLTSMQ